MVILSLAFVAVVAIITPRPHAAPIETQTTAAAPTPVPAPALPEIRRAEMLPVPVPRADVTPRAQLIHVRGIGTVENDRMPDGRLLTTLYKGELPTVGDLPRRGNQLGDMWFTHKDGHCWVLAPVTAGSSTVGWVDP